MALVALSPDIGIMAGNKVMRSWASLLQYTVLDFNNNYLSTPAALSLPQNTHMKYVVIVEEAVSTD